MGLKTGLSVKSLKYLDQVNKDTGFSPNPISYYPGKKILAFSPSDKIPDIFLKFFEYYIISNNQSQTRYKNNR